MKQNNLDTVFSSTPPTEKKQGKTENPGIQPIKTQTKNLPRKRTIKFDKNLNLVKEYSVMEPTFMISKKYSIPLCKHLVLEENFQLSGISAPSLPNAVEKVVSQKVCLESIEMMGLYIQGTVLVKNISFEKVVFVQYTTDSWKTNRKVRATFESSISSEVDRFFYCFPVPQACTKLPIEMCISYHHSASEPNWDNNNNENYQVGLDVKYPSSSLTPTPSMHLLKSQLDDLVSDDINLTISSSSSTSTCSTSSITNSTTIFSSYSSNHNSTISDDDDDESVNIRRNTQFREPSVAHEEDEHVMQGGSQSVGDICVSSMSYSSSVVPPRRSTFYVEEEEDCYIPVPISRLNYSSPFVY